MSEDLVVYWATEDGLTNNTAEDWQILGKPIQQMLGNLTRRSAKSGDTNFFMCPSVTNLMKHTFMITCPMQSSFTVMPTEVTLMGKNGMGASIVHRPSLTDNTMFSIFHSYYFFCEEEVQATWTAPYFSQAPHMQYGAIVPGQVNIGSWFRPFNFEFNLWDGVNEFHINEEEPMAYIHFETEKNVTLKQFKMNDELTRIAKVCTGGRNWEENVPLIKRYKRFKESNTNKSVIQMIKRQAIDD